MAVSIATALLLTAVMSICLWIAVATRSSLGAFATLLVAALAGLSLASVVTTEMAVVGSALAAAGLLTAGVWSWGTV